MAAALPRSLHLPFSPLRPPRPLSLHHHHHHHQPFLPIKPLNLTLSLTSSKQRRLFLTRASENGDAETPTTTPLKASPESDQLSEVGAEIKKAMKERELATGGGGDGGGEAYLSGVVEEIGQIEWPEFGKVLRTTGVVLGVIAGSSVVLLTLNAVLAELSDQVFAGRGVQDFFGG